MGDLRFDPATRSRTMAAIRGKNTGIEISVRRALHHAGFRFRLQRRDLPGNPDIVLPRYRLAVFVDGCFWHGHECTVGHIPKSRTDYWGPKILKNRERDAEKRASLTEAGWTVFTVRECSLNDDTSQLIAQLQVARAGTNGTAPGTSQQAT